MSIYLLFGVISFVIPCLLLLISLFFAENKNNEVSESPFECGFEPISFSRTPLSMQFFSITIVFLIFDLEIVIILPLLQQSVNLLNSMIYLSLIVIFLFLGLLVEWYDGSLNWSM